MPPAAAWLGGLGVLPFALGAAAIWIAPEPVRSIAGPITVVYAAVILSFLGGMAWGAACAAAVQRPWSKKHSGVLALSVVPALVGWVATFMPAPYPFLAMAVAFLAVLLIDRWLAVAGFVPPWWMTLRVRLSLSVAALLVIAAAGS